VTRSSIVGLCLAAVLATGLVAAASADAGGAVLAWGQNANGELGDGNTTESNVPVATCALGTVGSCPSGPYLEGATAVAAGHSQGNSFAVLANTEVAAWGHGELGELGTGEENPTNTLPKAVCAVGVVGPCPTGPYLTGVTAVAAGGDRSLALLSGGTVVAWGFNTDGELGNGEKIAGPEKCHTYFQCSRTPVHVCAVGTVGTCPSGPYLSNVTAIASSEGASLALLSNGTVAAWGLDNNGELGNGSTADTPDPVLVCAVGTVGSCPSGPYLSNVTAVADGDNHSLALLSNGTVAAWGYNAQGELGDGTKTSTETPVLVCALASAGACPSGPYLSNVTAIEGEAESNLALLSNATVAAWGANVIGELGNGTTTESEVPVLVCAVGPSAPCPSGPYLGTATGVAAGNTHSVAVVGGGEVASWGEDILGELGDGVSTTESDVPVLACAVGASGPCPSGPYLTGVSAVSAGSRHSLALGALPGAHWFKKNVELVKGAAHVNVATKGTLTLHALGAEIKCKIADDEQIWNPSGSGAGEDEVTAFTLSGCKSHPLLCPVHQKVEVISKGLPWPSHLIAGTPVRDEIEKIKLEVRCSGSGFLDEYGGALTPEVGAGVLTFASGSGELEDIGHKKATVTGADKLTAPPGKVTAK
jgi:alpha-tubulin suppressor-like RCC1 family protein